MKLLPDSKMIKNRCLLAVDLRINQKKNLREIGAILGVSAERARQILFEALKWLDRSGSSENDKNIAELMRNMNRRSKK